MARARRARAASQLLAILPALAALLLLPCRLRSADNPPVTITVDALANRHPISPLIYGVAGATTAQLQDLNVPANRFGGNNTTRYNWQLNADNRANDWYFESLPYSSAVPGEVADTFVASARAASAEPLLTIPTIGWIAKLGPNRGRLASFSIAKYGAQTARDAQWFGDAGNGISSATGKPITGNDPNDASVLVDAAFQQAWVRHLTNRWGLAASGGPRYYILDNEPSIWHSTHRDVHPAGASMEEVRDRLLEHAQAIKAVDPGALIVAPEEWGWSGYLFSGADQQYGAAHGWSVLPDRAAHGGTDYLPWLLDQVRLASQAAGRRLLDVFSVHYYPQGGEFGSDTSTTMQLLRNRSTRSLWDPNYLDQSWIGDRVRLIPRLKAWVASRYPDTRVAITEYNWGAETHINGATAQADVLGIFGREGLDLAARWTTPPSTSPTYKAIKLYRSYDGRKSAFGDISVRASTPDPDKVSAFAALRSGDGALTVMVVNKQMTGATPVTITLSNFLSLASAEAWQLTAANAIARLADAGITNALITLSVPPQSITLVVARPGPLALRGVGMTGGAEFTLEALGQPGSTCVLERSRDLRDWHALVTNVVPAGGTLPWRVAANDSNVAFYRAHATP
jgi:hypothetical protein